MRDIKLGRICRAYRVLLGITQQEVADELGYSFKNISLFENDKNDNYHILLWYINKGLNLKEALENGNTKTDN